MELAEFVVFRDTSETQAIPLQLYRNVEGLYPTDQYSAKCVLDGNPLTFFRSREDNATLIFDMGNVTEFKKILVIPPEMMIISSNPEIIMNYFIRMDRTDGNL